MLDSLRTEVFLRAKELIRAYEDEAERNHLARVIRTDRQHAETLRTEVKALKEQVEVVKAERDAEYNHLDMIIFTNHQDESK